MIEREHDAADTDIYELAPEEPAAPVQRWIAPDAKAKQTQALPCPQCGYDLRGLRSDRCPECGKVLNATAIRQAEHKRDGINDSTWFDAKAVAMAGVGLAIGATIWWLEVGSWLGVAAFGVDFVTTVVIGWLVFFVCSVIWIGFDQPLRMTVIQMVGAFGLYTGIVSVLALIPIPGIVTFFLGAAILVGLLSERLEIDLQDAIYTAVVATLLG